MLGGRVVVVGFSFQQLPSPIIQQVDFFQADSQNEWQRPVILRAESLACAAPILQSVLLRLPALWLARAEWAGAGSAWNTPLPLRLS